MRISKLLMPALTLAGALALAGCGGGSDSPGTGGGGGNSWTIPAGEPLIIGNTTFTCTGDTDCVITDLNNLPANVTRTTAPPEGITSAQCGEGRIPNDAKTMCVDDPDHVSSEKAKADAAALYAGLLANTGTESGDARASAYDYDAFKAEEGEKHHQKIMVQGARFEDLDFSGIAIGPGTPENSVGAGNVEGSYSITNSNGAGTLARTEATASVFAPGPTTIEHDIPNDGAGVFTTNGEWMGVSGTFYCVASCESQNGNPFGVNWRFKPGNAKDRVTGDDASWGWWVEPADPDASPPTLIHVRAFTDRGGLDETSAPLGADGSATYEGDATGKYAIPGEAGSFTAKASLTATFAATDTLSGEIKDFKDADGKDKTGWSVELKKSSLLADHTATVTYSEDTEPLTDLTTVWTRDGTKGNGLENAWSADLYGGTATKVPTHALGTFEAQHQGSHMVGAFGTEKKSESSE